jgi:hypothetical protein
MTGEVTEILSDVFTKQGAFKMNDSRRWGNKKGKLNIAPLRPSTLACFRTWGI